MLYAYRLTDGTPDNDKTITLTSLNSNPHSLWASDTTIWVSDITSGDPRLYAYQISDGTYTISDDFPTLNVAGNDHPRGIWSDGTTIWVADISDDKIYAYTMSSKQRDATKDFNTLNDAGNNVPTGIWSDGNTMWVADITDQKIYAYSMATKARDPSRDFNTTAATGNTGIHGLWSDGATMWVADSEDDKVYSYNMPTAREDATLSALSLSGITLSPAFDTGTTTYRATVPTTVTSTEVTETTSDPVATTVLKLGGTEDTDGTLDLALGANVITVEVTAEDTTTTETYTVTVTREARILSTDATLSALTVSPKDIIGFDTDQLSYEVGVASTVTRATVTATANDADASIGYSGTDASTDAGHQVDLSAGRNEITITVTAEDTTTTQEYTIRINRGVDDDYGWKASDDLDGLRATENKDPSGIWSNGTTMWIADFHHSKLYAYNKSDKSRDATKDFNTLKGAGNNFPYGIWSDNTTMWVADLIQGKVFAYNMSTKAHDPNKDLGTLSGAGNNSPISIWSDNTTMWVGDSDGDKLYAYNLGTKVHDSDKDFTLNAENASDIGIWSDGITMWAADSIDNKAYAYRMSDQSRDSDRDFNTLHDAGNNFATAIWSDGTTMWIADYVDDKVYSYNMPPSNDATLSALTVSPGTVHGFAADRLSYEVGVASTVTQATITATPNNSRANISYGDDSPDPGHQVNLSPGRNAEAIVVLAEDIITSETYTVNINRGVATDYGWKAADDLDGFIAVELFGPSGLTSDGTNFWITTDNESGIYAFNYLGGRATNRDVRPTADNTNSAYLWTSETTIYALDTNDLKVYAYQLSDLERQTAKEFSLNSENADPAGIWSDETTVWIVDTVDNKLYAYLLSGGARDADNTAPTGITSNGVTMWVADSDDEKIYAYTLSGTRQPTKEINALINAGNRAPRGLWSTADTLWVNDSDESKAYSYNIPMETPQQIISGDATLRTLTLTGMTLVPPFTPVTTSYTATVPNVIGSTRVTATPNHASATRVIKLGGDVDPDGVIFLAAGPNIITVEVTAEDETTTDTYTVTVTREAAALSEDATLRSLTISPKDIIGFDSDRESYEVGVASNVTQATITATQTQPGASVELLPADADGNTPGHQAALSAGRNAVVITVTSQDTNATKSYVVHINRGVTDDFGWKAEDDFDGLIAAGITEPRGMTNHDDILWVLDGNHTNLFAFRSDGTRVTSRDIALASDNIGKIALWTNGTTIWVLDDFANNERLFAYRLSDGMRQTSLDMNFQTDNSATVGIWSDGTTMWTVNALDRAIHAYRLSDGAHQETKDINLHQDNTTPQGIWSNTTTTWISDSDEDKLFAYDTASKERRPDLDFNTLGPAENNFPIRITGKGETLWVMDLTDDKIYSYNMPLLPPGNLQAETGDRRVTLTWNNPSRSSITGYQYRVSADDGSSWNPDWTAVPGSNARTTSYTVRNLANGISHTVQVRALEGSKESGPAELTATPLGPPSGPQPPVDLELISRDAALSFSWDKPSEDDRAPITSYDVRYRRYGSSSSWRNVTRTNQDDSTEQLVEGLTNRQAYEVQVAAVNSVGRGDWASDSAVPQGIQPPPENPDDVLPPRFRLGELAAEWTDRYPSDDEHPDRDELNPNLIWGDCVRNIAFRVFWEESTERAERSTDYEVHLITYGGAGRVTHRITELLSGPLLAGDDTTIYGTITLHKDSHLIVRVRSRYEGEWRPWSNPVGLYCLVDDSQPQTSQQQEESETQNTEVENSPANGRPIIRGTREVDGTLRAITTGISDPNGMDNAALIYQWIRNDGSNDSEITGATSQAYTVVADDVDNDIKVRVSFTDDEGFAESVTSGSVHIQTTEPLYGGFDSSTVPESHDGDTAFTFETYFSEEPALAANNVRDHVLTVTGGAITAAVRTTSGENIRWRITLRPDGDDDVTVVLPPTTDCDANGAVCTQYGKMLSNQVSITVLAPVEVQQDPPPKPTDLTATLNSNGSITLNWSAPNDDSVTGYVVLRRRPQQGESSLTIYVSDTGSTATTYTDTGTDLDTRYVYRVKAKNPHGIGPWSNFARIDK